MKRHTLLSDDELHLYLKKIRRIAKMDDEDALEEVDEFIKMIHMSYSDYRLDDEDEQEELYQAELEDAKHEIKAIKDDINRYQRELNRRKKGGKLKYRPDDRSYTHLRELLEELGEEWSERLKKELSEEVASLREIGSEIAEKMEEQYYNDDLNLIESEKIKFSRGSEIIAINNIDEYFQSRNIMTDKIRKKIRKIRERIAWARAKDKLLKAEVANGSGNEKKAEKLIKEAKVLLKQDWAQYFPNESPPDIEKGIN